MKEWHKWKKVLMKQINFIFKHIKLLLKYFLQMIQLYNIMNK